MHIDYGKIVTNALSALVAAVFIGAAAIVWNAATSIDQRISEANQGILSQQAAIQAAQDTFVPEFAEIKATIASIEVQLRSLNLVLAQAETTKEIVTYNPDKGFVLDELRPEYDPVEWQQKESTRLKERIDVRQMEILEKR